MASQCAHRFEELKATAGFPQVDYQCNDLTGGSGSPSDSLSALLEAGDVIKREGGSQSCSKVAGQLTLPQIFIDKTFSSVGLGKNSHSI